MTVPFYATHGKVNGILHVAVTDDTLLIGLPQQHAGNVGGDTSLDAWPLKAKRDQTELAVADCQPSLAFLIGQVRDGFVHSLMAPIIPGRLVEPRTGYAPPLVARGQFFPVLRVVPVGLILECMNLGRRVGAEDRKLVLCIHGGTLNSALK